jgi:surface polysaccharide O-acyltransferase-like enzyme
MLTALAIIIIPLIVAVFVVFHSALKHLSAEELQSFQQEKLFSWWYFAVLCGAYLGLLATDDLAISLVLAAVAVASTVYEHRKSSAWLSRTQTGAEFRRRMVLTAWLADAVAVAIVLDSLLISIAVA